MAFTRPEDKSRSQRPLQKLFVDGNGERTAEALAPSCGCSRTVCANSDVALFTRSQAGSHLFRRLLRTGLGGASLLRTALLSVSGSDSDSILTTPEVSMNEKNRYTAPWSICAMRFVTTFPISLGRSRTKFCVAIDTTASSPATSSPHPACR